MTGCRPPVARRRPPFFTVQQIMDSLTWKTSKSSIVLAWDENDYSGSTGGPGSPVGQNGAVLGGGHAPMTFEELFRP